MDDHSSDRKLKFLCFGMGAIGTYIGGSLALAGFPVSFIERPESIEGARSSGISIRYKEEVRKLNSVSLYSSLSEAMNDGKYDVALVAVKSFDSPSVSASIKEFQGQFPLLLCLQNGVENEAGFESVLGKDRVLGASICTAISKTGVGSITVEKMRGIGIESIHPLSASIINAFNAAGLNAQGYPLRADLKWSKMLSNLLGNATSAILNETPAQIFSDPLAYRIEVAQIRETCAVMRKMGIKVVNVPGTPIKPLIQAINFLPAWISRPLSYLAMGKGRGAKMPSFHIDLYNGQKRSEVGFLNGAVVRAGKNIGIKTPTNQVLTETLEKLAEGSLQNESFVGQPEKLLALIEEIS